MNTEDLARRRIFDLQVLNDMQCGTFSSEGYRTMTDLERRRNRVTDPTAGGAVTKYRWTFDIRTLVGPDRFAERTEIGVNTDVKDYPEAVPGTWILSAHVPWSPHFMKGAPVCIGPELWAPTGGHITLGELAIHIAHLLNWDEKGRGAGYSGYNRPAIEYHKKAYGDGPVDPRVRYPALPGWVTDTQAVAPSFRIVNSPRPDPGFRAHR